MTNTVVRKLEEKERILQNSLATVEKECSIRQQAMEMHKRKAIESAQSAADLKLHLGNYLSIQITIWCKIIQYLNIILKINIMHK